MKAGLKELCSVLCSVLCLMAMLSSYAAFTKDNPELYIPAIICCLLGASVGIAVLSQI